MNYIIPKMTWSDFRAALRVALIGALLGGTYGFIHDQLTYSLSPEYFTNVKFAQFSYADLGLGERAYAGTIGFIAVGSVGLIGAWLLARRLLPHQERSRAYRQIRWGFACVSGSALLAGSLGYAYGLWRGPAADYSSWDWALRQYGIADTWSFVRVAYIHNAGYLGAATGLIVALLMIRPTPAG